MGVAMERIRGGKRKKLEQLIIEAGYVKEYVEDSNFNKYLRADHDKVKIYIAKLARAMGHETNAFNNAYSHKSGISLDLAREILEFIKKNHLKINITLRL